MATACKYFNEAFDSVAAAFMARASASKFNFSIYYDLLCFERDKGELNKNPTSNYDFVGGLTCAILTLRGFSVFESTSTGLKSVKKARLVISLDALFLCCNTCIDLGGL